MTQDEGMPRLRLNGLDYNLEVRGQGPALVLLHGFTGCGASWARHAEVYAREFTCVAVDLPGHGETDSPADPARYTMERVVEDLVTLCGELRMGRAAWLGYSMGGRLALGVGVLAPQVVSALVLEGASPGLSSAAERAARVASDEALAARLERDGLEPFIDFWQSIPLFATQARLPVERREALRGQRLRNNPVGLANSLRGMGQGSQPPLLGRLGMVRAPTLLIAGEEDTKFRALAEEMAAALPAARCAFIPNAGHAAHFERPEVFDDLALDFLREHVS
jgi:2-succinyl-6-hydroxy-2,4-cyclohexadiene-1-carboxylate synthase